MWTITRILRHEERKLFYHGDIFIFFFQIFREPYSRYSGCPSEIPTRTGRDIGVASRISLWHSSPMATSNPRKATTMDESKLIIERFDFSMGKKYLRELLAMATMDFLDRGGRIQQCRPAFAYGCETKSVVRQAIRRDFA